MSQSVLKVANGYTPSFLTLSQGEVGNSRGLEGGSSLLLGLGFREKLSGRLLQATGLGLELSGLSHLFNAKPPQ